MANFKAGDPVQISRRDATVQDTKSGLFYAHYRGLAGTILKVYGKEEASVVIELDSLPDAIREGHLQTQEQMRERWLAGLADETRRRLKPEERQFTLRYILLVRISDLERRRLPRKTVSATAA